MRLPFVPVLSALAILASPGSASAAPVQASEVGVTFHIEEPKAFDGVLAKGGGKAVLQIDPADIGRTGLEITIRTDKFTTDNELRDSAMLETIEGLVYPTLTWKVATLKGESGAWKPGKFEFSAEGPLTFHGQTHPVKAFVAVVVTDKGLITADGEFSFSLEKFGVERPRAPLINIAIDDIIPVKAHVVWNAGTSIFQAPAAPVAPSAPAAPATP